MDWEEYGKLSEAEKGFRLQYVQQIDAFETLLKESPIRWKLALLLWRVSNAITFWVMRGLMRLDNIKRIGK